MRQGELRHPEDKVALIEKLVFGSEKEGRNPKAPFGSYRELFIFAACVGFEHGRRREVVKGDKDPVRWSILANNVQFEGLLYLFGIAHGNPLLLAEDQTQELLRLFESYCNGGLEIIGDWLTEASGTTEMEVICTHVLSQLSKAEAMGSRVAEDLIVPEL